MATSVTKNNFTVENLLVSGLIVLFPFIKSGKDTLIDFELLPKQLFVGAVGIALLAMLLKNKEKFRTLNLATGTFLLFVIANVISISTAINTAEAWGTISRTFVFTALFFGLIMGFLNQKLNLIFIAKSGVVFGLLVGFMSFADIIEAYKTKDALNALYGLNELYVHKNFLASALLMALPLVGFTAYKNEKYWGIAAKIALAIMLLDIALLRTRSVWLALVIASVLVMVIYFIANKNSKLKSKSLLYFGAGAAGFLIILFFVINATSISESTFDSGSLNKRTKYWKASWEMYKESPVTGIGAGNWRINFPKHGLAGLDKTVISGQTTINRPHNDFLWILSETGILGFIGFLLFLKITFWYLLKVALTKLKKDDSIFALLSIFGMVSFVIYGFFEFPIERPDHFFFFLLYAAWGIGAYLNLSDNSSRKISTQVLAALFLLLSMSGSYIIYQRLNSAIDAKQAVNSYIKQDVKNMVIYGENAESKFYSLEDFGNPVNYFIGVGKLGQNKVKDGKREIENSLNAHPYHILSLIQMGDIYKQNKEYDQAFEYYSQVQEFAPGNRRALLSSAEIHLVNENYARAVATLNRVTPKRKDEKYMNLLKYSLVRFAQNPPSNKLIKLQKALAGAQTEDQLVDKFIAFKQNEMKKSKLERRKKAR